MGNETTYWDRPLPLAPDVSLHVIEESGILLCEGTQDIYSLNTSACFVFFCLQDGTTPHGTVSKLQDAFGLPRIEAQAYVEQCVEEWDQHWITSRTISQRPSKDGDGTPRPSEPLHVPFDTGGGVTKSYKVLDLTFEVEFPSSEVEAVTRVGLANLETNETGEVKLVVGLTGDNSFQLRDGSSDKYRALPLEGILPEIKNYFAKLALDQGSFFLAFHAAALRMGSVNFLLAGPNGSGKSTLAAAFLRQGCDFYSDDIVFLAETDLRLRPFPFGAAIKEGAWDLLEELYPRFSKLPVHVRQDGKRVRYLAVDSEQVVLTDRPENQVHALIFVSHFPEAGLRLEKISKASAVRRLLLGETALRPQLDSDYVSRIIEWIETVELAVLTYSDAEPATSEITKLLEGLEPVKAGSRPDVQSTNA